jgi:zinc-ribbon domain
MFCDKCGTPITAGAQFCSSCGKAVGVTSVAAQAPMRVSGAADGRVQRHIQLLATLWLANGVLRFVEVGSILIAGQLLPFVMSWGVGSRFNNWPFMFLPFGLYGIAGILGFFGVAHLFLAWGLFQRESWARPLGIVIGFLALLRPPFGTALGIYTIWVLLPQHAAEEYERMCRTPVETQLQPQR